MFTDYIFISEIYVSEGLLLSRHRQETVIDRKTTAFFRCEILLCAKFVRKDLGSIKLKRIPPDLTKDCKFVSASVWRVLPWWWTCSWYCAVSKVVSDIPIPFQQMISILYPWRSPCLWWLWQKVRSRSWLEIVVRYCPLPIFPGLSYCSIRRYRSR